MNQQVLFGADPELFAARPDGAGGVKVVPPAKYRIDEGFPVKYLDSDPYKKHPVFSELPGDGGVIKVIEDGAAFELTVPPSTSIDTLFSNIQTGYEEVARIVAQFGHFVEVTPAIPFDTQEFRNRSREFLMSLVFGCDPDMDVFSGDPKYGMVAFEEVEDALLHPWRYGGGHLHLSGIENFQVKPLQAVRMLAYYLGNLATSKSPFPREELIRTYRYGKPGRFRIQEYGNLFNGIPFTDIGIEYRTLSNSWTASISLAREIAEVVQLISEYVLPNDKLMEVLNEDMKDRTIDAIMKGDVKLASENYHAARSFIEW